MIFDTFDEATAAATENEVVCGTLLSSGVPKYFLVSADTPDDEIRDRSFEIREGRQPSAYERWLLRVAMERAAS